MRRRRRCPECDSTQLSLTLDIEVTTGAVDGRLKANEVCPVVVVGCDECSATVEIVRDAGRLRVQSEVQEPLRVKRTPRSGQ